MSRPGGLTSKFAARLADSLDERYHLAGTVRHEINKAFPKHFSFLWGELALYSFVVLVLSGTYLAFFFDASTGEISYRGPYDPLYGVTMSRAYASTLYLSFEVRGGLFVRQLHHWSALVFIAAIVIHMFRTFFTGAFRKPRELTWLIGVALLLLSIFEAYMGYTILDDLLSGQGLRIFSGLLLSIPLIGTWVHWAVFNGEFEGESWLHRFYLGHILIVPVILATLIAVHLAFVWYQHHTQFPGKRKTEQNVVGYRTVPAFTLHSVAVGLCTVGVLAAMGGLFQIYPTWNYGPYETSQVPTPNQPDWYAAFDIGALRLFPRWDIHLFGHTVPAPFWPGVLLPLLMFALLAAYPYLERRLTLDRGSHNLLQRPRDNPTRTAIGAMAITFYAVLLLIGGDDVFAIVFRIPFEYEVWAGRIGLLVLPPLAYWITYRACRRLQDSDREILEHGIETGLVRPAPGGGFIEVRQPVDAADQRGQPVPVPYQGAPVPKGAEPP